MLTHLARETQQHHASADGDRLAIMEKPTPDRYLAFLGQIYCFEAPIEAACIATAGLDRGLLRSHLKSHKLATDLDALGLTPAEVHASPALRFDSPGEALAWMWVLHRNTLLHGLIYRYLQGKLPESVRVASEYLSAFEGRAGALMHELGDALGAAAKRTPTATRIIIAAHDAFRMQRHWYSCDALAPRRPSAPRTAAPKQAA